MLDQRSMLNGTDSRRAAKRGKAASSTMPGSCTSDPCAGHDERVAESVRVGKELPFREEIPLHAAAVRGEEQGHVDDMHRSATRLSDGCGVARSRGRMTSNCHVADSIIGGH